jgi:glycosyltransferase involved in cell wall biosynthesis
MKVTVILPAHNEEAVIGKMILMLLAVYSKWIAHVIVVDDCSSDRTPAIVRALQKSDKRIILIRRKPPGGVGLAIRDGLAAVPPDTTHILSIDADFIRNIPDLFEFFDRINYCDGLIGSRYIKPHSLIRYPMFKKICNRMFHLVIRLVFGIKHKDISNNFKLYKKSVFNSLPLTKTNFAVNAETGIYPILMGFDIREIPVTWYAREDDMGFSKFNILKVATGYISVIIDALAYSKNPQARILNRFLGRQHIVHA